nr:hypothetical protein [Tanacetum cinerariifolium]
AATTPLSSPHQRCCSKHHHGCRTAAAIKACLFSGLLIGGVCFGQLQGGGRMGSDSGSKGVFVWLLFAPRGGVRLLFTAAKGNGVFAWSAATTRGCSFGAAETARAVCFVWLLRNSHEGAFVSRVINRLATWVAFGLGCYNGFWVAAVQQKGTAVQQQGVFGFGLLTRACLFLDFVNRFRAIWIKSSGRCCLD